MLKRSRKFLFVFILLWAVATSALCHGFDDKAKIDPLARPWVHDRLVVGLVIGIVKDGQSQVIAYGETRKGSGTRPDGNTLYEIGSISKVFTGVLLSLLVEEHGVSLEDPLQKYLPPSVTVPVFAGGPITLEHLATHTSGLPRMPDNFNPADPLNPYADYTVAQMYAFLEGHKLGRPPGNYTYSNYGMGLLGHALAHRMGMTYEQLLKDRICKPLGMKETGITLNEAQQKRLAPPYTIALKPTENWDIPTLAGAGAIRSSVNDMIIFIRANLKKDRQPLTRAMQFAQKKATHHGRRSFHGPGLAPGPGREDPVAQWRHRRLSRLAGHCPGSRGRRGGTGQHRQHAAR